MKGLFGVIGNQEVALWRQTRGVRPGWKTERRSLGDCPGVRINEKKTAITVGQHDVRAVAGEAHYAAVAIAFRIHDRRRPIQKPDFPAALHIPSANGSIERISDEPAAILRKSGAEKAFGMTFAARYFCAGKRVRDD